MSASSSEFHKYRKESIARATALCEKKKSKAYSNGGVDIRDYWKYHGLKGLAFELYKRTLRMVSTTNQDLQPEEMADSLEDMALDFINYGSFLYAEAKCLANDRMRADWKDVTKEIKEGRQGN